MGFTTIENPVRALKPGDPEFTISNGIVVTPRAGFQVNSQCPKEYMSILAECFNNEWVIPVAYVTEKEYLWMNLGSK